jgi:riboflavin synthase
MFTGIIEDIGEVTALLKLPEAIVLRLKPKSPSRFNDVVLGESIAVNGVCLTIAEPYNASLCELVFYVSPETLARTQFHSLNIESKVNLERAMKISDRLSGHIVRGHVDGVGSIHKIEKKGDSFDVIFKIPENLEKYCIEKGSICLNGVSLTINRIEKDLVHIMMIPHTWDHTQFHTSRANDPVNIEVDVLAKYIEKLCLQKA